MRTLRRRFKAIATSLATAVVVNLVAVMGFVGGAAMPAYATPPGGAGSLVGQVDLSPTSDGLPGGPMMQKILNWLGQFGLWGSLAAILVGAAIWGVSQQFGNGMQTGKGKILVGAGAIGAVLTGLAAIIVNTLFAAARG